METKEFKLDPNEQYVVMTKKDHDMVKTMAWIAVGISAFLLFKIINK